MIRLKNVTSMHCHLFASLQAIRLIPQLRRLALPQVVRLIEKMEALLEDSGVRSVEYTLSERELNRLPSCIALDEFADAPETLSALLIQPPIQFISILNVHQAIEQEIVCIPRPRERNPKQVPLIFEYNPFTSLTHGATVLDAFANQFNRQWSGMYDSIKKMKTFSDVLQVSGVDTASRISESDLLLEYAHVEVLFKHFAAVREHYTKLYETEYMAIRELGRIPRAQQEAIQNNRVQFQGQLKGIILGRGIDQYGHYAFLYIDDSDLVQQHERAIVVEREREEAVRRETGRTVPRTHLGAIAAAEKRQESMVIARAVLLDDDHMTTWRDTPWSIIQKQLQKKEFFPFLLIYTTSNE